MLLRKINNSQERKKINRKEKKERKVQCENRMKERNGKQRFLKERGIKRT